MDQNKNPSMTPEEKASLKDEVIAAVEKCFSNEEYNSKEAILDKVAEDIEALKEGPEMGGMGAEAEAGMKVPEGEVPGEEE